MKQAKDYIIFPLDVPTLDMAKRWVSLLSESVGMFKLGLELYIRSGPEIIEFIHQNSDANIFLDLKLHDIPETVKRAMQVITELKVALTTVHCGESSAMLAAAVEGSGGNVGVLGVTVLTSVSRRDIEESGLQPVYVQNITNLVMKRARHAKQAGCRGIVCSGHDVSEIKKAFGNDFIAVTPGIRPAWNMGKDDQRRITTPAQAVQNGSDYVVIGRPIRDAHDPINSVKKIMQEIEMVL